MLSLYKCNEKPDKMSDVHGMFVLEQKLTFKDVFNKWQSKTKRAQTMSVILLCCHWASVCEEILARTAV